MSGEVTLRRALAPLFVLVLLGLLVACGDDDDDPTATEPDSSGAANTATSTESSSEQEATAVPTPTTGEQAGVVTPEGDSSVQIIQPPERSDDVRQDGRTLGPEDADVVLTEYGDFQ